VSWLGKVKTFFQMGSITLLLSGPPGNWTGFSDIPTGFIQLFTELPGHWIADFGQLSLGVAVVLTIWSMVIYLKAALPDLKAKS
jgi:CDP-diacylglycerol--glycerol-3-phosphate 3-phosphatidyltransferase